MTDNLAVSHNSRIITTKDGKKYEKAGLAKTTAAVIAANAASRIVQAAAMHLGAIPFSHVTLDENNDIYKSAAEKTFKKTGLDKKGIKFINITPENFDDVLKEMDKKSGILEKIPFLTGEYQLEVAIEDLLTCEQLDYWLDALRFQVNSATREIGISKVEHKWIFEKIKEGAEDDGQHNINDN